MLGYTKNWMHDEETHSQSVIDNLVTYHNLMEAEKKLTAKERMKMKALEYQGPYMEAGKPNWINIGRILVVIYCKLGPTFCIDAFFAASSAEQNEATSHGKQEALGRELRVLVRAESQM
jgi:hypothetical protein